MTMTLFDELGGTACLERVHRIFYGKLLAHPWLRGFFHGKDRDHLESQQTDFMTGMFGGPKCYFGRAVGCAHIHLFISDEVFTLRHGLLADSLAEAGVPATLAERWLAHDRSMKRALIKETPADCKGRFANEEPVIVPKPGNPAGGGVTMPGAIAGTATAAPTAR